jgi:hypothetical protein
MTIQSTLKTFEATILAWGKEELGVAEVAAKAIFNALKIVFDGLKPTLLSEFITIVTTGLADLEDGDLATAETAVLNLASADLKAALTTLGSGWIQALIVMAKGI